MIVTKREGVQREIPHEPGEWMKFRPISWSEKQAAKQARSIEGIRILKELPADIYAQLRDEAKDPEKVAEARAGVSKQAAQDQYDELTVLASSITAWSYSEPKTRENISGLDEKTKAWAFEQAIDVSRLSLGESSAAS